MNEEQMRSIYCNVASVEAGLYDFKILVGLKKNDGDIGNNDFDAQIIMSPQHAKSLLNLLDKTIKEYEKTFGKIPGPIENEDTKNV